MTDQRIPYRQIGQLVDARTDRNAQHALDNTLHGINHEEDTIRQKIRSIRAVLDDIERHLDAGYQLNSAGELQGRALDLDLAVVKHVLHWNTAAALLTEDELASIRPTSK